MIPVIGTRGTLVAHYPLGAGDHTGQVAELAGEAGQHARTIDEEVAA